MEPIKKRLQHLLRWTELTFKTDVRYILSGGSWAVAGQIASTLSTFVIALLVSRFLPKEVYGEYKYILATVALLSTFSLSGLSAAVLQSVASGFDGALKQGFVTNLRWSSLMVLGAFVVAGYYFLHQNMALALGILIGGCLSPILTSAAFASTYLAGKKDFARQTIYYGIWLTIIYTVVFVATILLTKNVLIITLAYFLSNTLASYYFYRRTLHLYHPDNHNTDPHMLTYSKHLSLMNILSGIAGNIDQILLFHFVGPADLAVYNFATAIPDQAKGPLKTLDTMTQARFAPREHHDIRSTMRHKMVMLFLLSIAVTVAYIAIAPYIFKWLFPNYIDAVRYSQIYMISTLSFFVNPIGSYFSAKKLVRTQYVNNIIQSIYSSLALFIGVYWWGLMGLIIARVIIRMSGSAITYTLYRFSFEKSSR